METYSDAYINYWGRVFTHYDLFRRRRIRFDRFLQAPHEILTAVHFTNPVAIARKRAQARIDAANRITRREHYV